MQTELLIALISLAGTFLGTIGGIITANRMTSYRIDKLEERIEKMDALDEKVDKLELRQSIQEECIKTIREEMERTRQIINLMNPIGEYHRHD